MYKKWLNIFKNLHIYTIFLAKTFQIKKPELSTMPVSRDILPQKYILFLKSGYTFGAHCTCIGRVNSVRVKATAGKEGETAVHLEE